MTYFQNIVKGLEKNNIAVMWNDILLMNYEIIAFIVIIVIINVWLTLKRLGGGTAPLDVSRDKSATRVDLAAPFHSFISVLENVSCYL